MEKIWIASITPAAKADGRVAFTIIQNTGVELVFDLTEAQASTLASAITTALS